MEIGDVITVVHRDFVATCEVVALRPRGEEPVPEAPQAIQGKQQPVAALEGQPQPAAVLQVLQKIERAQNGY
jgi:hypothetical protein